VAGEKAPVLSFGGLSSGCPDARRPMTQDRWRVALEAAPDQALGRAIQTKLAAYNTEMAGPGDSGVVAVSRRGPDGDIVGGLWGRAGYGFLFVELLTTGPASGLGLGRAMMDLAEAEARRRGLIGMWLTTWTFQAPEFYRKLGFEECGRISGFPPGHDHITYVKRFATST
jgi:GNAT superfamily N-acetyltransferase